MEDSTDWLGTQIPNLEKFEDQMRCPICRELLARAPTITECGHTFCGECILRHFNTEKTCPLCRASIQRSKLRLNKNLEELVDTWTTLIRSRLLKVVQKTREGVEQTIPKDYAECPLCQKVMSIQEIQSSHIDNCQAPSSKRRLTAAKKLSLPVFKTLSESKIKALLTAQGLSTRGGRQRLIHRYEEWVTLFNTNLDTKQPRSTGELRKQLVEWDKAQDSHTTDLKNMNLESYSVENKSSFDNLIAQAKRPLEIDDSEVDT